MMVDRLTQDDYDAIERTALSLAQELPPPLDNPHARNLFMASRDNVPLTPLALQMFWRHFM